MHHGFLAVNNTVFDVGAQTATAINRLMQGVPADRSGPAEESRNGNGSLMRVLPLVLWHKGPDEELAFLAARQSLTTHGHARAQVCCAMYCLWARAVLNSDENPWGAAEAALRHIAEQGGLPVEEVVRVLDPANTASARGTGYVLDTLWSARWSFEKTQSYEDCVRRAVSLGHDTDTTAAVVGGIAGLRYGVGGIPERWLTALRGKELFAHLLSQIS
jgi:ADP-ribosylglycohydrolase